MCPKKMRSTKITEMDRNGLRSTKYMKNVQFSFENVFLKNVFCLPESRHFALENTISENEVLLFSPKFW